MIILLRIEFLKPDGQSRYRKPLWLLWSGLTDVPLPNLAKMYLWRLAIEHLLGFLTQHLGLSSSVSNDMVVTEQWMWLCAMAFWQLLLMRELVEDARPAWQPCFREGKRQELTARQVQWALL